MKKRIKVFGITGTVGSGRRTLGLYLAEWHAERGFSTTVHREWMAPFSKVILDVTTTSIHIFYHIKKDDEVNEMREAFGKDFIMVYLNCPEYRRTEFNSGSPFVASEVSAAICDRIVVNDACLKLLKAKAGVVAMNAWMEEKG